jgi:hypothetical protein
MNFGRLNNYRTLLNDQLRPRFLQHHFYVLVTLVLFNVGMARCRC